MGVLAREIPAFEQERFLAKIRATEDCWIFEGAKSVQGYGCFSIKSNGKHASYPAHRISYSLFVGCRDMRKVIDHICRNKACVNPDHLREVSTRTNILENSAIEDIRNHTHCPNGHEYFESSTYIDKRWGSRVCRVCKNLDDEKRRRLKGQVQGMRFGSTHQMAKLKDEDVLEIRRLIKNKIVHTEIAKRFGIKRSNVSAIGTRKNWKHLPEEIL